MSLKSLHQRAERSRAVFQRVGAHEAALRIRRTMYLCQAAPGNTSSIARLSPSWASEVTQSTPSTPLSRSDLRNAIYPAWDSVPMASRPRSHR